MRNKYYADNLDLIKWSVLIRLAEQYKLSRIIQVAYLRPSTFNMIDIAGQKPEPPPPQVLAHFRDIRNVAALHTDIPISVFDLMFDDRTTYHEALSLYLEAFKAKPRLVFLDPDTGLQPARRFDFKHVLCAEAHAIWSQLNKNEVFAFYQHKTTMAGKPWIEKKRTQLEKAIKVGKGEVLVGQMARIRNDDNDVVIFFVVKP